MRDRIDELAELRARLESGDPAGCDELKSVGQALRGSGATFGFPDLSAAASVVETTTEADALRRSEGLIAELHELADERADGTPGNAWLARAAGITGDDAERAMAGAENVAAAWAAVQERTGLDATSLARRVADRFGLPVADLGARSRAARRLVPEALMSSERLVPLVEDATTITVATADPTSLSTELELQRLTGRRPVFAVAPPSAIEAVLAELFAPDEAVPAERRPPAHGPGEDILVVDDEESQRVLLRGLLEKRGYAVVEAADGLEALEMVRSRASIGLAVVDLNMPRMDGLELLWELRDASRWNGLPVIVVTGEVDDVFETQLMEEGADDYIRKPVDPRLFLARIDATLRRVEARAAR